MKFTHALLTVFAVFAVAALIVLAWPQAYRAGGRYLLEEHDHADIMVAGPETGASKRVRVLFVGNSITYVHDIPGMLANIAASDPGNTVRLEIQAKTHPNAELDYMLKKTDALDWAHRHRPDVVVLQEHSSWYADSGYNAGRADIAVWVAALRPQGITPVLFQVWGDDKGSIIYSDPKMRLYGETPADDAADSAQASAELGESLKMPVVWVGRAFSMAGMIDGVPDLYGPDHHHASAAGAYLAALVFYRYFTGRSGSEATYRPFGMSAASAAKLVELSGY